VIRPCACLCQPIIRSSTLLNEAKRGLLPHPTSTSSSEFAASGTPRGIPYRDWPFERCMLDADSHVPLTVSCMRYPLFHWTRNSRAWVDQSGRPTSSRSCCRTCASTPPPSVHQWSLSVSGSHSHFTSSPPLAALPKTLCPLSASSARLILSKRSPL
jgi:hypothetical protein